MKLSGHSSFRIQIEACVISVLIGIEHRRALRLVWMIPCLLLAWDNLLVARVSAQAQQPKNPGQVYSGYITSISRGCVWFEESPVSPAIRLSAQNCRGRYIYSNSKLKCESGAVVKIQLPWAGGLTNCSSTNWFHVHPVDLNEPPSRFNRFIIVPAGGFALREAVRHGDLAAVETAIRENHDLVFCKDFNGQTPMHLAAVSGQERVVELLVTARADVNVVDDNGWTPLHLASFAGNTRVAASLLADGANVNAKDNDGATPLHLAAAHDYPVLVGLLLEHGAQVNARDVDGWQPLHLATANDCKKVAELLLDHHADVNPGSNNGMTPLHLAAAFGRVGIAKLLLAANPDVNARNSKGKTPLYYATHFGHDDMAEFLVEDQPRTSARVALPDELSRRFYENVAELLCQHGGHE
jgi:ankyrin repeat protein